MFIIYTVSILNQHVYVHTRTYIDSICFEFIDSSENLLEQLTLNSYVSAV